MGISYDWDEALPANIPEVDWTQFSPERMSEICEDLDIHVNMSNEIDSYTHPSSEDLNYSRWRNKEQNLIDNHKREVDWRDEEIRNLNNLVDRLNNRIYDLERGNR